MERTEGRLARIERRAFHWGFRGRFLARLALSPRLLLGAPNPRPPILILGCGHSGTSLLLALLDAHSRIFGIPFESKFCLRSRTFLRFARGVFDRWAATEGRQRWVEKTPRHIRRLPLILDELPEARVIVMVRDGRDVAASLKGRTGLLLSGIQRWVHDNTLALPFLSRENVTLVRYEDLVEDPPKTLRRILAPVGEEFEPGMLDFHKRKRRIFSARTEKPDRPDGRFHNQYRNWQINQPIFDGRGRWRSLERLERVQVEEIGGRLLRHFGYTRNREWCLEAPS